MATLRKFEFETSFDVDLSSESEQREVGARAIRDYTEDDITAARNAAYTEGRETALKEALSSSEHIITELLPVIGQKIDAMREANETVYAKVANDAIKIAVTIAHKVMPELSRQNAFAEIEGLVRDCLNTLYEEPRVVVRVHDRVLDTLKPRIDEIANSCGFNGTVVLFGDSSFADTDCRVEWADGGAERNIELLWREIDEAISRVAGDTVETYADSQARGTDIDDPGDAGDATAPETTETTETSSN